MKRNQAIEWRIDGIVAGAKIDTDHPTFERGATETIEFVFAARRTDATTNTLGGENGTTLGGDAGGTLSSDLPAPAEQRWRQLRRLIDYPSTNAVGTTLDGRLFVREYRTDSAEIASRIVRVQTGSDVRQMPSFWAAVEGGEDTSTSPGRRSLALDMTYLAPSADYAEREELLSDLSSPIEQL